MNLFTNSEANACIVWKVEQFGDELLIGVQDGNILYDCVFTNLSDSSSASAIKEAVVAELIERERLPQRTNVVDNAIDETAAPIGPVYTEG